MSKGQITENMNTLTILLLAGFGVVSGVGLGMAASPIAKLARYMHDADHVSHKLNRHAACMFSWKYREDQKI